MNTLRMIAWGFIDFSETTPAEFKRIRQAVRDELRPKKLGLMAGPWGGYSLMGHYNREIRPKKFARSRTLCMGTFEECCKHALTIIDPDYRGGNDATR
jgi:hypothetical protein